MIVFVVAEFKAGTAAKKISVEHIVLRLKSMFSE